MGGEEGGAGEGGISKLTKTQCSEGRGKTGILYLHFEKKKRNKEENWREDAEEETEMRNHHKSL